MADHATTLTVMPYVPVALVNARDLDVLDVLGVARCPVADDRVYETSYYFYTKSGFESEPEFVISDPAEFLRNAGQAYPAEGYRPEWVNILLRAVEAAAESDESDFVAGPDELPTAEILFQSLLNKPGWENPPDYIQVMGSTWCSKTRPNEFGGFVVRITPQRIVELDTWGGMDRYLPLLCASQAVVDRWERGDLAGAVRDLHEAIRKTEG